MTFWWIFFGVVFTVLLTVDLLLHRRDHVIRTKEALIWSVIFIIVALIFNVFVYIGYDHEKAFQFLTAYIVEKSLSVDNIFVFLMIFSYFGIPPQYEHRVLFWGIIGAIVMRAIFIFSGVALIQMFHWILYVFGFFLIITAIRMAWKSNQAAHPEKNIVLKYFRRFFSVTTNYRNGHFWVKENQRWYATPLFVILLTIESSDLIFAVDSIPAVLAISHDPFIVYTSNVFAILGLRALYFALAGFMKLFAYLHYGLSAILAFIGVKMLLPEEYKPPIPVVLVIIVTLLLLSILFSLWFARSRSSDNKSISGERS